MPAKEILMGCRIEISVKDVLQVSNNGWCIGDEHNSTVAAGAVAFVIVWIAAWAEVFAADSDLLLVNNHKSGMLEAIAVVNILGIVSNHKPARTACFFNFLADRLSMVIKPANGCAFKQKGDGNVAL